MKGVHRGLKSRQQRDQLATLDRGSGENVGSTCREGTPAGPFARPDVRPGGESDLGTAGSTFSPLSLPRQGQVQTEPVKVCRVVLDGPRPRIPSRIRLWRASSRGCGWWARYSSNLCGDANQLRLHEPPGLVQRRRG